MNRLILLLLLLFFRFGSSLSSYHAASLAKTRTPYRSSNPWFNAIRTADPLAQTLTRNRDSRERFGYEYTGSPRYTLFAVSSSSIIPSVSSTTVSAILVLFGSSAIGSVVDRFLPSGGILATIVFAATLSNLQLAPLSHSLYDACWTIFLPASLSLLLLANRNMDANKIPNSENSIQQTIRKVSIPFLIGSMGSVLGCVASFYVCKTWPGTGWLPPADAAIAAGCLCASYIGGSVNFFATAKILQNMGKIDSGNSALMTSMSAADLIVMAVYFAWMAAALKSKTLQSVFSGTRSTHNSTRTISVIIDEATTGEEIYSDSYVELNSLSHGRRFYRNSRALFLVGAVSISVVIIANRVARALSSFLPGTECAIVAFISIMINRCLSQDDNSSTLWKDMQYAAAPLSDLCFHLFFASIGISANLGQALRSGPSCLAFSSFALLIHIAVTLLGSIGIQRLLPFSLHLEDVLVGSNAAIGGPATAAAFAGRLKGPRQQGLIMAATTWGVIGYAVATVIGLLLSQILGQTIV